MVGIGQVLVISLAAGCATGFGSIPIFFADRISHRIYDGMIALSGGILTSTSVFALILPGLETGTLVEVTTGIFAGGLIILSFDRILPPPEDKFRGSHLTELERRSMIIGGAIILHNFPEGLAIGIAFGTGLESIGYAIAIAIGIQNIPDGFAFSVPAEKTGLSRKKNVIYTTLSGGGPEPLAAVIGFCLASTFTEIFPFAAGFAAGSMLAVVFREIIPESHGHKNHNIATIMFLIGFILMMIIK